MRSRVTPSLSNWHRWSRHIQYSLHNCNFEEGHKISFLAPSWWPAASPHQDGEGGTIACQDQRKTCTTVKCIRWLLFSRYQELCQHLQVFDLLTVVNCFGSPCWQLKHLLAASCWQLWHLTSADYCQRIPIVWTAILYWTSKGIHVLKKSKYCFRSEKKTWRENIAKLVEHSNSKYGAWGDLSIIPDLPVLTLEILNFQRYALF